MSVANPGQLAVAVLLALAVLLGLISAIGALVMRTPLQRLHYVTPAAVGSTFLVALAVSVSQQPYSGAGLKAWCIAATVIVFAPILGHQTGRAADIREDDR